MAHTTTPAATVNTTGRGKFQKGYNAGTGTCLSCGARKQAGELRQNNGNCDECYDEAGLENEHQDGYHAADQNGPEAACPTCRAEATEQAAQAIITAASLPLGHEYTVWTAPSMAGRCKVCGKRQARHQAA